MIDYNVILGKLVGIAQEAVGSFLSVSGNQPSVIISRPTTTKPAYPYIVVDAIDTRLADGPLGCSGLDDNNNAFYESIYTIQFQYTVYGTDPNTGMKSQAIAQRLESYFRIPRIRDELYSVSDATLEQTFPVTNVPEQIEAKDWTEAAFFTLTVTIRDRIVEDTGGEEIINTIDLDGDIKDSEDDSSPVTIDINVTSL